MHTTSLTIQKEGFGKRAGVCNVLFSLDAVSYFGQYEQTLTWMTATKNASNGDHAQEEQGNYFMF